MHIELSWTKNCIMSTVGNNNNNDANTFQITKTELYVPVVTLNTDDTTRLNELLSKGFERKVFWNEYKSKLESHMSDVNSLKRIILDSSFEGVNKLFILAYVSIGHNPIHI